MVSRRYLRVKTMQALFAHSMKPYESLQTAENTLIKTIHNSYTLFLWFLSILPATAFYRSRKFEELKNKHNPTPEDLYPNTRYVDNQVIAQIEQNDLLQRLFSTHHINWENDMDFITNIFHIIEEIDEYKAYMSNPIPENPKDAYKEDKKLVLTIIEKIMGENEMIRWFFGEKDPNWVDDYEESLIMCYKNISKFKYSDGDHCKILPLFDDQNDEEQFCRQLFKKTIVNDAKYEEIIESKLQHWELERVISMDILLMKMAICELTEFPTIPVKVTLNEYIDIAKLYSSDKSKVFINGVLDRIVVDMRENESLNKSTFDFITK